MPHVHENRSMYEILFIFCLRCESAPPGVSIWHSEKSALLFRLHSFFHVLHNIAMMPWMWSRMSPGCMWGENPMRWDCRHASTWFSHFSWTVWHFLYAFLFISMQYSNEGEATLTHKFTLAYFQLNKNEHSQPLKNRKLASSLRRMNTHCVFLSPYFHQHYICNWGFPILQVELVQCSSPVCSSFSIYSIVGLHGLRNLTITYIQFSIPLPRALTATVRPADALVCVTQLSPILHTGNLLSRPISVIIICLFLSLCRNACCWLSWGVRQGLQKVWKFSTLKKMYDSCSPQTDLASCFLSGW